MLRFLFPSLLTALVLTTGCSSNPGGNPAVGQGGGNDLAVAADLSVLPSPPDLTSVPSQPDLAFPWPDVNTLPPADHGTTVHPPLPTFGNPTAAKTITAPKVYTIVWKGDETLGHDMNDFTDFFLKSSFWTTSLAEYGVNAGSGGGVLVLPDPPPAKLDIGSFGNLITNNLGMNGWPMPDANTIFSFIIDPNTSVTSFGQPASCVAFGGFHQATFGANFKSYPYAVSAYCKYKGQPDFAGLTTALSHELGEAATDPLGGQNSNAWIPGGGEVGDACLDVNADLTNPANGKTYTVQRMYSSKIAKQGAAASMDPCLVDSLGPYFGVGLWGTDAQDPSIVAINTGGSGNGSATFKLEPFSFDPAIDEIEYTIVGAPSLIGQGVSFSPDIARRADPNNPGGVLGMRAFGVPGSTLTVTVTVTNYQAPGGTAPTLLIVARTKSGRLNIWWGQLQVN